MFLWARHPALADTVALSNQAAERDIMLGPGHLFSCDLAPSPWLRFNVAFSQEPALYDFLQASLR
jgi:DNA-binding transcriptional MocR family regulator